MRGIRLLLTIAAALLLFAACGRASDKASSKTGETATAKPEATATSQKPAGEQRLAFVSNRDGAYHLYTMNADGGDIRKLSDQVVSEFPYSVSQDGTQIAAWEGYDHTTYVSSPNIYRINVADGTAVLLGQVPTGDDEGGAIMTPFWLDNDQSVLLMTGGQEVCYSLPSGGGEIHEESPEKCLEAAMLSEGPAGEVAAIGGTSLMVGNKSDAVGRELDQIMTFESEGEDGSAGWGPLILTAMEATGALRPVWSPDGNWIAYVDMDAEGGQTGLSIVSVNGGEPRLLVPFDMQKDVLSPKVWSADGKRIIFSGSMEGSGIQDVNVDSGEVRTLAGNDGFTYLQPEWVTVATPPERAVTPSSSAGQAAELRDVLNSECGRIIYEDATSETGGPLLSVAPDGSDSKMIHTHPAYPYSLSADGNLIAYNRRDPNVRSWPLVVYDVDRQEERELGAGGTPGLSPSGKMLAYWSDGLTVMDPKTGEQRKVYDGNPSDVVQPAWSPDETRIASLAKGEWIDTSGDFGIELIVVDLRTDTSATIASLHGVWPGSPVAWSPDGSRIAFTDGQLHLVNVDGGDRHNYLTDADSVAWSPSGDTLVVRDSGEISLVNPKSGIETWLTSDAGGVVTVPPAWSPDGSFYRLRVGARRADGHGRCHEGDCHYPSQRERASLDKHGLPDSVVSRHGSRGCLTICNR